MPLVVPSTITTSFEHGMLYNILGFSVIHIIHNNIQVYRSNKARLVLSSLFVGTTEL